MEKPDLPPDLLYVKTLGEGTTGVVFLVQRNGEFFALKMVARENQNAANHRLVQELMMVVRLNHPNVVKFVDAGFYQDSIYILMEYVSGWTLDEYVRRFAPSNTTAIKICKQILAGLSYLHRNGVIHRDVKPSNILVARDQKSISIKLIDFTSAHFPGMQAPGKPLGTHGYMSPEQLNGEKASVFMDIFSVGCVLLELITEGAARQKNTLPWTQKIIDRALSLDLERRYASADEMLVDLETGFLLNKGQLATSKIQSRRKFLLGGGALIAATVGGAWYTQSKNMHDAPRQKGVTPSKIHLGLLADFNGISAEIGLSLRRGIETGIDSLNQQPINDRVLQLALLDDSHNALIAQDRFEAAIRESHGIMSLISTQNALDNDKIGEIAHNNNVMIFAPWICTENMFSVCPSAVILRAPFEKELMFLAQELIRQGASHKKIALVVQNDTVGKLCAKTFSDRYLHSVDLVFVARKSSRATKSIAEKITHLHQLNRIDAVILATHSVFALNLIANTPFEKLTYGIPSSANSIFSGLLNRDLRPRIISSQCVPDPMSQLGFAKNFRENWQKFNAPLDPNFQFTALDGYYSALVFGEVLRRTGKNPSRQTMWAILNNFAHNFSGIEVNFVKRINVLAKVWTFDVNSNFVFDEISNQPVY